MVFRKNQFANPAGLVQFMQKSAGRVKLQPDHKLVFRASEPGRLVLEARLPQALADQLQSVGHDVQWWPDWTWKAGAICMIDSDPKAGLHHAGADPRRSTYALGW